MKRYYTYVILAIFFSLSAVAQSNRSGAQKVYSDYLDLSQKLPIPEQAFPSFISHKPLCKRQIIKFLSKQLGFESDTIIIIEDYSTMGYSDQISVAINNQVLFICREDAVPGEEDDEEGGRFDKITECITKVETSYTNLYSPEYYRILQTYDTAALALLPMLQDPKKYPWPIVKILCDGTSYIIYRLIYTQGQLTTTNICSHYGEKEGMKTNSELLLPLKKILFKKSYYVRW